MKNILLSFVLSFFWIWFVFAINNYFPSWNNWDANVINTLPVNDEWVIDWRLDLEDSLSSDYGLWKRWKITWTIESELFGFFDILWELELTSTGRTIPIACTDSLEVYDISWTIKSSSPSAPDPDSWWELNIQPNSFFCSNQFIYISFYSDSLGYKDIWNVTQVNLVDNFDKQQIAISGITTIKWDENNILNRENDPIDDIYIDTNKKVLSKSIISKNIVKYTKWLIPETSDDLISMDFDNPWVDDKFYYYDYIWLTEIINFNWSPYVNKWKILTIWDSSNSKIWVSWKNTVLAMNANIHITDNIYNTNDNNSLLVLVAKRDKDTWNWWNIYIDPSVTNIDAVLIADWSVISMQSSEIQYIWDAWLINNLRKQLLIFGSIISSNNVWSNELVYWTDLYEDLSIVNNEIIDNIYDLWNLRTFNLNYWELWTNCVDENELAPIDWSWSFITNAWAWAKYCYIDDAKDSDLRESDKKNPVIVEYNSRIQLLNPVILSNN